LWLYSILLPAQQSVFRLRITDASGEVLPGAVAVLYPSRQAAMADGEGLAIFNDLPAGKYRLEVSYLGYETYITDLQIPFAGTMAVMLKQRQMNLQEVRVIASGTRMEKPSVVLPSEAVGQAYVRRFYAGSLAASLERLPGVSSISIGVNQSKPVIRGLAFHRVLVVEDGLRHESQQWGEEHGLEIDALSAGKVEVIRGPSSVRYGSDAIGGVLNIVSTTAPGQEVFSGHLSLLAASVNQQMGLNSLLQWKEGRSWAYVGLGWRDAADSRVPADSVDVYNFRIPLRYGRLRNTAGMERSFRAGYGFSRGRWNHQLRLSAINSRQGFFAHAHGIEPRSVDTLLHDQSQRDIQYPYHEVLHLKFIGQSRLSLAAGSLQLMLGYQKNLMDERSAYVSHGFMPSVLPSELMKHADLERHFVKDAVSAEALWQQNLKSFNWSAGLAAASVQNRIGGWAFIFPGYHAQNIGLFSLIDAQPRPGHLLQAGLRLDGSALQIAGYRDWFASPDGVFVQRAHDLSLRYLSLSWSGGYGLTKGHWSLKANAGKSFRLPTAAELGANGVNYHQFRFEQGNAQLRPETSYQFDLSAEWRNARLALELSPFTAWSPNYIYLNPTAEHDYLYGNGNQKYVYTQAQVFRAGGELHLHYGISETLVAGLMLETLYSRQLSGPKKGFGLPISPPASGLINLNWSPKTVFPLELAADVVLTSAQRRIVPPEAPTPGWYTINLRANALIQLRNQPLELSVQLNNLTNTIYFNHLSYYRRINLPEAGRNVMVVARLPIDSKKLKPQKKI
jgi:iron complex outermembrane receptor protein